MQTTTYGFVKKASRLLVLVCAMGALLAGCQTKDTLTVSATELPAPETEQQPDRSQTDGADAEVSAPAGEAPVPVKTISVHVCGAVNDAGVCSVPEDARVIDAVQAAGGFAEDADTEAVNLAAFLVDGCRLRIPSVSETDGDPATEVPPVITVGTDAQPADSLIVLADGISDRDGKINLNTASAEELCTLNGIGPKRASDIIRYREEHGAFTNIEEVMNVNGIKQSLFAKIRAYIRV